VEARAHCHRRYRCIADERWDTKPPLGMRRLGFHHARILVPLGFHTPPSIDAPPRGWPREGDGGTTLPNGCALSDDQMTTSPRIPDIAVERHRAASRSLVAPRSYDPTFFFMIPRPHRGGLLLPPDPPCRTLHDNASPPCKVPWCRHHFFFGGPATHMIPT
jgi:hypothetical protein